MSNLKLYTIIARIAFADGRIKKAERAILDDLAKTLKLGEDETAGVSLNCQGEPIQFSTPDA